MNITDIFIKRPVLASVVSLMILVLGIRSLLGLPVRQFPYTENAVVTVTTTYYGADPDVMAGFITTPLETSIAQANGIDYLTSSSTLGTSTIQANLILNYDSSKALSDINTKVNAVINQLPKDAQQPVITVAIGETIDSMYMGFYSDVLPRNKITDYLIRVVQPKLQAVPGVQLAEILGTRQFALRAWLDPAKMAAYNLTATEVSNALASNDFISAVGRTDGQMVIVNLTAETGLHSVEEFKNLVLRANDGAIIKLSDVANVTLGAENYDTEVKFDGNPAVYIGIKVSPTANLLTAIDNVRKIFPTIEQQLPEGLSGRIVYDGTKYVYSAIHEVEHSLTEALLIVTGVVFIFLGSVRSVTIPVVAIPLSLIGAFFIMLLLGYSVNLLTLLALVLAIGLVVDDAIIVVENIYRHMEAGMSRLEASLLGAKELANPIIAISVVLIAVYVPIGFMGGLTGALFSEFAFTLAGAVGVSAVIALTLSPMMCSKLLKVAQNHNNNHDSDNHSDLETNQNKKKQLSFESRFVQYIDKQFARLSSTYQQALHHTLDHLPVIGVFAIIVLMSIGFLYTLSKHELAPQEDQGIIISLLTAAPNASLHQTQLYSRQVFEAFKAFPETEHIFQLDGISGLNTGIAGMVLKPWDERDRTAMAIQPQVQNQLSQIAGANIAVFQRPPLPGTSGLPVQVVIGTTDPFDRLNEVAQIVLKKIEKTGMFMFLDIDLKIDKLQTNVTIDREKAALMGLNMRDVGNALSLALGGNYVNYFNLAGRSYKVIPQVSTNDRLNDTQLLNYYINATSTPISSSPSSLSSSSSSQIQVQSIPLSTVAQLKRTVVPESLNHFQQLNSATISGVLLPSVTQGQALDTIENITQASLPGGYSVDYAGLSRQFKQESSALVLTFFFALIIIFLTLAALFESFRDPLIVLISVPMSICGAMIFISLGVGGASLNIYTEVGLVTLIGLISKHGILIVQFANDLQLEGKSKREAIEMAASIRLRPILMTTAAMVLGVVPLILASGAGAVSRYNIGLVVATGISIGTLFTLFVVPAMYLFLADVLEAPAKAKDIPTSGLVQT
jgi:multidrug efflux pump